MFARSDLGESPEPPAPYRSRAIGALVLLVCIALLVLMALSADTAIFIPYNATHAATETSAAKHPPGIRPVPRGTPRGNPNDQHVLDQHSADQAPHES